MSSLHREISERIINPKEYIQLAEESAKEAIDLLKAKDTKEKDSFKLNKDDSLEKQADSITAEIESFLEKASDDNIEKKTEKKSEKPQESQKSAMAKIIELGIENDAVHIELIKQSENETKFSIPDMDKLDIDAINEKVALRFPKINFAKFKKPALVTTGAGVIGGGSYFAGKVPEQKKFKRYVHADLQRDISEKHKAFRFGQNSIIQYLRSGLKAQKGGTA